MQIECKELASILTSICFSSSNLALIVIYISAIKTLKIAGNMTRGWESLRKFPEKQRGVCMWGEDSIQDFLNYFFVLKKIPDYLYYLLLPLSES